MPALALGAGVEAGRPEGRLPQPPRHETMVAWTVCESGGGGRGRVGQREAEGFQRDSADNLATAPPRHHSVLTDAIWFLAFNHTLGDLFTIVLGHQNREARRGAWQGAGCG